MSRIAALLSICTARQLSAQTCSEPLGLGGLGDKLWGAGSGYDKKTRPSKAASLTSLTGVPRDNISLQIHFFSIPDVSEVTQSVTLEVKLLTSWVDERLNVGNFSCFSVDNREIVYSGSDLDNIWLPDIKIANLLKPEVTLSSVFWIGHGGLVNWTRRALITISCEMDFTKLPFDVQLCPVRLYSVRDGSTQVALGFMDPPDYQKQGHNRGGDVEWSVTSISPGAAVNSIFGEDDYYTGLSWDFYLERIPTYYKHNILQPSHLMVVISWFSFFVARAAAPARVTMTVIVFLTITTLIHNVQSSLPRLAQTVWLLQNLQISLYFVLYSAVEYAVVNWLMRIEARLASLRAECDQGTVAVESPQAGLDAKRENAHMIETIQMKVRSRGGLEARMCANRKGRMRVADQQIDIASRVLFPAMYAIAMGVHYALVDQIL